MFSISCSQRNLSWNITGVEAYFRPVAVYIVKSTPHQPMTDGFYGYHTKVFQFTGKWVDYSFVLLESTRSIFYSPYPVNLTVTNELLEVYKTLISAKTYVL